MTELDAKIIETSLDSMEFDPTPIEQLLEQRNMSQADLARLAGYKHRNTVNRIIKQKREATATDLIRFCAIFDEPVATFVRSK